MKLYNKLVPAVARDIAKALIDAGDIEVEEKGLVYAPQKPGLGYEIDWDLVEKNTLQTLR